MKPVSNRIGSWHLAAVAALALAGCGRNGSGAGDEDRFEEERTSDVNDGDGGGEADGGHAGEDGEDREDGGDGTDGGASAGDGDADGTGIWAWCPEEEDYVGEAGWQMTLSVPHGALYCAGFDEVRTLQEEMQHKARLWFVPGEYHLPGSDGTFTFRLPACVEFPGEGTQPLLSDPGTVVARHTAWQDARIHAFTIEQPMVTAQGDAWLMQVHLSTQLPPGETVVDVLDGNYYPPESTFVDIALRWDTDMYPFLSCHFETAEVQGHYTVTFDGGRVDLHRRMGWSGDSTEPAVFWRAAGELDGEVFEQLDYYKLIYNPEHHHFRADFGVLFDPPVAGTAGVVILDVDQFDPQMVRVYTTDEALLPLGERAVQDVIWQDE